MKYTFFFLLIFTFSFVDTVAQQVHFLYFQTENSQAFYIKLDNKVLSSTASGYLVVPKLKEGNYKFIIGFPKSEWPEEVINYALIKDAGLLIKNFADKGWGLFDLQTLNVIMPGEQPVNNKVEESIKNDSFSNMLATVVNDSSIKQKVPLAKNEIIQPPKQNDVNNPAPGTPVKDALEKTDIATPVLYSIITKNLQVKNKGGMEMIYTDQYNNNTDTISVFLPVEKGKKKKIAQHQDTITQSNQVDTLKSLPVQAMVGQSTVQESKTEIVKAGSDTAKNNLKEDKIEFLPVKAGMINSNCKQSATEDDFLKLRKKMASEKNDDNMINSAKKIFKLKCFTTNDIKNLSALFLTDGGKYNFFDAAYPYVSDSDNFLTLENQLSDEYYIKRFKVMIHQ